MKLFAAARSRVARFLAVAFCGFLAVPTHAAPSAKTPPPAPVCVFWESDDSGAAAISKTRAQSVVRLLAASGIATELHPRSSVPTILSSPRKVAFFVSIPKLRPAELAAVRGHVARGGKLICQGCLDPGLAALFGVRIGSGRKSAPGPHWTGIVFCSNPPLHAPPFLENRASEIWGPASPAAPGTTVVARWRTIEGAGDEAAILKAAAGYWFVRPLYDDGSAVHRVRFLAAMTCALDPTLWRDAAKSLEAEAWKPFGEATLEKAERAALQSAPGVRKAAVKQRFASLRATVAQIRSLQRKGLYGASMLYVWGLRDEARLAFAESHPINAAGKKVYVWFVPESIPAKGCWPMVAARLRDAGVTDVLLHAGSLAGATADIPGVPASPTRLRVGNPFPEAIAECHRAGIRVHAWFPVFQFEQAPADRFTWFSKNYRLLHKPDGTPLPWLDPPVKGNAADLSAAVCALARSGVDGVSLDYIRYPDGPTREVRSAKKVTDLLARLRRDLRSAAPTCRLSVAVYGFYPFCVKSVGQDWVSWLDQGLVDETIPMNYVPDVPSLTRLAGRQPRGKERTVCGIGASSTEARLDAAGLILQIREAFRLGYAGVSIYRYDTRFEEEFLPALRIALRKP